LLQPKAFVSLFEKGHLAPQEAYWALPIIIHMICLQRDIGDPVNISNLTALISNEIPPMWIILVDVQHPLRVLEEHHVWFIQLVTEMKCSGALDKEAHHAGAPGSDS
ncbi:uncharacterized protein P174DRAFT_377212, partial [Aspergillus novofumigatus IBT 16806]